MFGLEKVDVSIGFPPFEISGSFRPSKAERLAAWELLVELGSRTTVAPLRPDEGLIREALTSLYKVFDATRTLLRTHGPEVGATKHDGNLSLGVIALRVLNEVLRPALSRWHPLLTDHESNKPPGMGQGDWERMWPRGETCRAELNDLRFAVRAYVDTLGRIARTPAVADSVVPAPPAVIAPLDAVDRHSPVEGFPRERMVRWWDLREGIVTAWKAHRAAKHSAAQRTATASPRPITYDRSTVTDRAVIVDYVADMGDAFDATMAVAWQLGRKELTLPRDPTRELPDPGGALPRGELLVLGGDEVYPYASKEGYANQLLLPYQLAGIDLRTHPVLAIPGNHDYYGGIEPFESVFLHEPTTARPECQDRRWFTVRLPGGWWIWGFDTGLDGTIDQGQRAQFTEVAKELKQGDRVIVCTPVPLWQLRQKKPDEYRSFRQQLDQWLGKATAPLHLSGDSHYCAILDDLNRAETHVTTGGGGAFLHPTHSLVERIPYDGSRPEFQLRQRWPSPAASRALGRTLKPLRTPSFLALALLAAGLAWLLQWSLLNWGRYVAGGFTLLLLLVAGRVGTTPNAREGTLGRSANRYGFGFGLGLAVLFGGLTAIVRVLVDGVIDATSWRWAWFGGGALLTGALMIVAFYRAVQWLCARMRVNDNLAFSALSSGRYKHFARLRFHPDGKLDVSVIGLDPIGKNWWKTMVAERPVPPSDPDGSPHLHYVWGTTFPATKREAP